MSRVCQVTGKKPMVGNNRSHAKNATRRRFLPNLQNHRFWLEEEKRFVQLRVSTKGIRIIDKKGIVREIHTGFSGPSTGAYYADWTQDFDKTIQTLLKEN